MPPRATAAPAEKHAQLNNIQRQARFAADYVRAIAAQAGCGFSETTIDEDTMAVDGSINYPAGVIRVQVKSTHRHAIGASGTAIHYAAQNDWIRKWKASINTPVYFIVVVLPDDSGLWLDHDDKGTMLVRSAAYWSKIDAAALESSPRIDVPRSQRLTAATLAGWYDDYLSIYGGGAT